MMERSPKKRLYLVLTTTLIAFIAGTIGFWLGNQKDNILILKSAVNVMSSKSSQPIDPTKAQEFILSLHKSLDLTGDKVIWPKDYSGERVTSWYIDMQYIKLIQNEIEKIDTAKYPFKGIRLYPVINNRGEFSIMLAGGYNDGRGSDYVLKYPVDTTGEQTTSGSAPIYEWLDPCPPFHCPDNDFKFK